MNLDFRSEVLLDGAHRFEQAAHRPCVCAECKYAQLFAVQPRALCQHPTAFLAGRVLFAGQPSCADFVALRGVDVRLGAYVAVTAPDSSPARVAEICAA